MAEQTNNGLDERIGLDKRPTTLMESITASITEAVRGETERNTEVLGSIVAQIGRLDRHLASLAEMLDGTATGGTTDDGAMREQLDALGHRLDELQRLIAEPAPSADMASVVDGLTELRRALASARRAIDDGLHEIHAAGGGDGAPVDLSPVIERLDALASREMPVPEMPAMPPVDLSPVIERLDALASREMPVPAMPPVDLTSLHVKLDVLASREPQAVAAVDLHDVHAKLDALAAREVPTPEPVDLSPVLAAIDALASRETPVAEPVDLSPVLAAIDALASRETPVAEPVELSPVLAALDALAAREMPKPEPVDLSGVTAKLDALASREHREVDTRGIEQAIAKLAADLDSVRLLAAQSSRAPDVARLLSDVTLLRQEVSATQDRLQGLDRTVTAFRADLSGANDAQSMFRVSEAVAATAAAIARLERRVGVGLDELRDLIEHVASEPPPPAMAPRALPAAPGETRERVAGQMSERLSRIREAAAGVSDAVRAERARRRQV